MKARTRKHAHKKDTTKRYSAAKNGMFWFNTSNQWVLLCNFRAKIRADIIRDDGTGGERLYELEVRLGNETKRFYVEASKFPNMQWVAENIGAAGNISAGYTIKDNLRAAIQSVSYPIPTQTVYSHVGWRAGADKWLYLHKGGAISDSTLARLGVKVDLTDLDGYALPQPPGATKLKSAIRASLSILSVAPPVIAYPLLAAAYRAPLCEVLPCDFSLFLMGQSGCQKSELTALAQAHFGSRFNRLNLPANWTDTSNALEKKAFLAKDAIFTVDDFAPSGTPNEIAALHAKADRLLRGQGNQRGRGRMTATCDLRRDHYPRGLILSSGEDVPKGHSLSARFLTVEIKKGDVNLDGLTELQEHAGKGVLALAMAGYILWLSPQLDQLKDTLPMRRNDIRSELRKAQISHDRTPDNIANLALGMDMFFKFAEEQGAIDAKEKERLMTEGMESLRQLGNRQREQHLDSNPAEMFLRLLRAAISSGKCHLKDKDGRYADNPEVWGWANIGDEENPDYRSQGDCIGWTDGEAIFLDPIASFKTAQLMGSSGVGTLAITPRTLHKRLKEAGLLATTGENRHTATVRKTLQGQVREVLHMRSDAFWGKTAEE